MTIVRVRGSGFDKYGDPTGTPSEVTLSECFTAPRTSEDQDDRGRQGVVIGLSLFCPYGTDLLYTDQVKVDGDLYDIEGEPGRWRNPLTTWEAGIEIALKRAEG